MNKYMPESMRAKFPNVRAIIDCEKFKVETKSSPTLHKIVYSQLNITQQLKAFQELCLEVVLHLFLQYSQEILQIKNGTEKWVSHPNSLEQRQWLDGRSRLYSS